MNPAILAAIIAIAPPGAGQAPVQPLPVAQGADRPVIQAEIGAALTADLLPKRDAAELRPTVSLALTTQPARWVTLRFDGEAEALVADRDGGVTAARGEVRDGWIEARGARGDLRAGYGRLVWGRLDEVAPTDVINPLDTARFLLEGRSEARLPVAFVRGRLALSDSAQIEGVLLPLFRRGLFDRLDEPTSPFNLVTGAQLPPGVGVDLTDRQQREPPAAWENISGGARATVTAGGADVGVAAFRGFDGLGPVVLDIGAGGTPDAVAGRLVEHHPRFTMLGADIEAVSGQWVWRGEFAAFVERTLASAARLGLVNGKSFDAGAGFDRRVGEFRAFGSVIVHREWSDEDPIVARTDVNVIGSVERSFGRDVYLARAFAVVNPADASAFLRGLLTWRTTDEMTFEMSGGLFLGTSDDNIGRFRGRDFVMTRVRLRF